MLASGGLLAEQVQKEYPYPVLKLAQNILDSCHSLEVKLGELFDLAKGEVGILELELEPLDPLPLLQDVGS